MGRQLSLGTIDRAMAARSTFLIPMVTIFSWMTEGNRDKGWRTHLKEVRAWRIQLPK